MMDGSPPDSAQAVPQPHNVAAEQAVLGSLLLNNEVADRIGGLLKPEHFFDPVHQRIYEAAQHAIARGQLASPITLKPHFAEDAGLADLGGPTYFVRLAEAVVSIAATPDYAKEIVELARRREVILSAQEMIARVSSDLATSVEDQVDDHSAALDQMREQSGGTQRLKSMATVLNCAAELTEAALKGGGAGYKTGIADLDLALGGLYAGDLTVIGGRPAMGKSAVAAALLKRQVEQPGRAALFMSLEMTAEQNAWRMISEWLTTRNRPVPYSEFRRGTMTNDQFMDYLRVSEDKQGLPLFWTGPDVRSLAAIEGEARRYVRKAEARGLQAGPIVIDYLNLITLKASTPLERITMITARLKEMALRLKVPVVLLAQLNRGVEAREDKRPVMSDLRESGSIEQDADNILLLYRDEYYAQKEKPAENAPEDKQQAWSARLALAANKLEIILGKVRSGDGGTVKVGCDLANNHFWDLER